MYIGYNDTMRKYHQMIWVCPKILDLPPIDGKLDAENDDKTCVRKKKNKSCCHEISLGTPEKHGGVFLVRIMSDTQYVPIQEEAAKRIGFCWLISRHDFWWIHL